MTVRRLFAPALLAMLLLAPTAQANTLAAPKLPVKVAPKITLTPVARAGNFVRPQLAVGFALPAGVPQKKACKGKVAVTAVIGKKTVKKHGKTKKVPVRATKRSPLKLVATGCMASGAVKLPVALIGKTVKFTALFKGNSAVKKFSKSSRLLVTEPAPQVPEAPRIDPVKGAWTALGKDSKNEWQQWTFTVNPDGSVSSINRLTLLNIACPGYPGSFTIATSVAPFDTPFSMTYVDTTASDGFQQDAQNINQTFKMYFDSPSHATGSFQMTGAIEGPQVIAVTTTVYPGCDSGAIPLQFTAGAPT